jgi:hypothetical protein
MQKLIVTLKKNSIDEIRVAFSEFKGHKHLDIKVYTELEDSKDKVPTKKGLTIRPDLLPGLIEALQKAHEELTRGG